MFNNLGFHTEIFTPISVLLLIAGGILGYGSEFIVKLFKKDASSQIINLVKVIGLLLVLIGVLIIFTR